MATETAELKDGFGGNALVSGTGAADTSEQSGETFCYDIDGEPIDEYERYEWFEDLYPTVRLRRVRGDDGEFLPIDLGADIVESRPDYEDLVYSLVTAEALEGIRAINHTIPIYRFRSGVSTSTSGVTVPGLLTPESGSVEVEDMWVRDGGTLPTWAFFIVRYEAHWVGTSATHSVAASVNPLQHVIAVNLIPNFAPFNGYVWHNVKVSRFTFAGDGTRHVAHRPAVTDYAPWAGGGAAAHLLGTFARYGGRSRIGYTEYRHVLGRGLLRSTHRIGGSLTRAAQRMATLRAPTGTLARWIPRAAVRGGGYIGGTAAITSSVIAGAAGYDIADVYVTPVDGNGFRYAPSKITLTVD